MPFATRALITVTNTGAEGIDVVAYRVSCIQTKDDSTNDRFCATPTVHRKPPATCQMVEDRVATPITST